MSKHLALKAAISVAFFLSVSSVYAESSFNASITGSASGDSHTNELELGSNLDYRYSTKQVALSSGIRGDFTSDDGFSSVDNWQADNVIRWRSLGQRVTGSIGYIHAETDRSEADLVKSDSIQSQLAFSIPISQTASQGITVSTAYESSENSTSDIVVDDWSGTGSYSLRWSPARNLSIVGVGSYQKYDSGSSIKTIDLSWQRQIQSSQVFASVSKSWTEEDDDESELTGGKFTYNHVGQHLNFSVDISRSQTDALSFFDTSFDTNPIEQQTQLMVDTLTISISEIKLSAKNLFDFSYQIGRSETLTELNKQSDSYDISYSQFDALGRRLISSHSSAETNYRIRREDPSNRQTQELEIRYQNQVNKHWNASASLSHDLKDDSGFGWTISLTYKL